MKYGVKLISVAVTVWLFAASYASSAELHDGDATDGRRPHAAGVMTGKLAGWRTRARTETLLGFEFEHGVGVPQSYSEAFDRYMRAAEQGDPTGQYLLGLMYDKGHGVWQDTVLALKWLNLAAAHAPMRHREYYLRLRDAVASKMTPSQISLAQRLAFEWVPKGRW